MKTKFLKLKYALFVIIIGFAIAPLFADNENYYHEDLQGTNYDGQSLINAKFQWCNLQGASFNASTLIGASFLNSDIRGADFTDVDWGLASGGNFHPDNFKAEQIYETTSYKIKDLSGVNFTGNCLSGWDFSGQNLQMTDFSSKILDFDLDENMSAKEFISNLSGANFSDADIKSSNFAMTNFSKEQLYSTASYKSGDLSCTSFGGNDLKAWDFFGQNLQNSDFASKTLTNYFVSKSFTTNLEGANFAGADLRGANLSGAEGNPIYKNTIMTDGRIENFSMTSASDSFSIRKYEPASSGGSLISAKLDTSSTISGGAVLTLERGADFEVTNNSTLSVAQGSSISINTDASSSTSFSILAGSGLVFENGAILEINLDGIFTTGDSISFVVFDWENGGSFEVIGDFVKDESIFLSLNGEKFNGDWNYNIDNNKFIINISQVPEPSAYAAMFGALALALTAYRKRK